MNMSYCRFENTSKDLRDCADAMQEVEYLEDLDLSKDELRSMKWMRELAEQFIEEYDRLMGPKREDEY